MGSRAPPGGGEGPTSGAGHARGTRLAAAGWASRREGSVIVGRDEPLVVLERFVGGVAAAPATLVIEGEAGIGKTTVWQAGIDMAARRGYRGLACRPVEAEAGLAYAGLADLLAGVEDDCFDVLPGPQRDAIDVALLRSPATGRAAEPRAIFTAFGGVLRALTRDVPVLVAVDDRQWLDSSTQRALEFVSRRLVDEPIGMLVAARVAGAPASATGPVLRLGPLGAGALHRLIKTPTGVRLSRPAVMRVHRTTAGNPFFALELARVLVAAGLPEAGESWPVPEDLRDMVSARLARLPSAVRSALLVAAADARPAISGLDDVALATAEQAGIVTIAAEGRVRFAHPLFAAVITAAATAAERRRVHARLAARAEDVEERARHRALACEGPDEDVARLLDRAAAAARARGAPDIAAELAERAAALTPPDRPGAMFARRLTAAEHHFHAGDLEHCATLLAALTDVQPPGVDRSHALRLLGETRYRLGSVDEALALLRRAIDAAAGDPSAIARAQLS